MPVSDHNSDIYSNLMVGVTFVLETVCVALGAIGSANIKQTSPERRGWLTQFPDDNTVPMRNFLHAILLLPAHTHHHHGQTPGISGSHAPHCNHAVSRTSLMAR